MASSTVSVSIECHHNCEKDFGYQCSADGIQLRHIHGTEAEVLKALPSMTAETLQKTIACFENCGQHFMDSATTLRNDRTACKDEKPEYRDLKARQQLVLWDNMLDEELRTFLKNCMAALQNRDGGATLITDERKVETATGLSETIAEKFESVRENGFKRICHYMKTGKLLRLDGTYRRDIAAIHSLMGSWAKLI